METLTPVQWMILNDRIDGLHELSWFEPNDWIELMKEYGDYRENLVISKSN